MSSRWACLPLARAYKLHLKILLRWVDEVAFDKAPTIRPVFPKYLSTITRIDRHWKDTLHKQSDVSAS